MTSQQMQVFPFNPFVLWTFYILYSLIQLLMLTDAIHPAVDDITVGTASLPTY